MFRLAWVPDVVLIYHSISFRFWTADQKRAGHPLQFTGEPARTGWLAANFITGALAVLLAWIAG